MSQNIENNSASQLDSDSDEELSEIQRYQKKRTMQKNIKEYITKNNIEDSPLFMVDQQEIENSTLAQAIQAMSYEDPPHEVADGMKLQGNDALKEKNYKNAIISYTSGIDICIETYEDMHLLQKKGLENIDYNDGLDPNLSEKKREEIIKRRKNGFELLWSQMQEIPDLREKMKEIEKQIYNNRAQVHLILQNYRKCIEDCREVLQFDPSNIKAIWRTVKSAFEIRRYKLCLRYCEKGLKMLGKAKDKSSEESRKLFEKYKELSKEQLEKIMIKKREEVFRNRDEDVLNIIRKGGIKIGKDELQTEQLPPGARLKKSDRVLLDENSKFIFQVIFLYDEFYQSDFIQVFHEDQRFIDHLSQMFPPEGPPFPFGNEKDQQNFIIGNIRILFLDQSIDRSSTLKDRYINVDLNATLGETLRKKEYLLPNNLLPIFHIIYSKY